MCPDVKGHLNTWSQAHAQLAFSFLEANEVPKAHTNPSTLASRSHRKSSFNDCDVINVSLVIRPYNKYLCLWYRAWLWCNNEVENTVGPTLINVNLQGCVGYVGGPKWTGVSEVLFPFDHNRVVISQVIENFTYINCWFFYDCRCTAIKPKNHFDQGHWFEDPLSGWKQPKILYD